VPALLTAALLPAAALAQDAQVTVHNFRSRAASWSWWWTASRPARTWLRLLDAVDAPISLIEELTGSTSLQFQLRIDDLSSVWRADVRGRV
jgi:hypothetical protein